ncbi:stressosome-associated protein Prli42 [Enterococcus faecalis]|nr:stressosome-associated protein Prli42 [Enterococcus faecalis]
MNDKEQSRFSKITKVVVWLMLIAIVGSTVLTAILNL